MSSSPLASIHNDDDDDVLSHPEKWCLSYHQLLEIDQQIHDHFGSAAYNSNSITMRDVCREIILPMCDATGTCFALSKNPAGLDIDAFVTHSWDGPFPSFVQSIKTVFQGKIRKPNLWICAFSLKQSSDPQNIKETIFNQSAAGNLPGEEEGEGGGEAGDSLRETPFAKAIAKAKQYVCIRNSTCDLYGRIWCVCEVFFAKQNGLFPDHTFVSGPDDFRTVKASCVDAQATCPEDKIKILRALLRKPGDAEMVDAIIQQFRSYETPDSLANSVEGSTPPQQQHRSQEEIKNYYTPILKKKGTVCRKKVSAFIRKATKGEFITTTIAGVKETDNQVKDDSSWVVCGLAGEFYILTQENLETSFDIENAKEIKADGSISPGVAKRLCQEGYRVYQSKRKVWAYEVQKEDLQWFLPGNPSVSGKEEGEEHVVFGEAPWGSLMRIEPGDFLVTQYPWAEEGVYRVERYVFFDTYEEEIDEPEKVSSIHSSIVWLSCAVAVVAFATIGWMQKDRQILRK